MRNRIYIVVKNNNGCLIQADTDKYLQSLKVSNGTFNL